jgi:tetratricopeptide (TPR) repeat protein
VARAVSAAERAWTTQQGNGRFVDDYLRALQIQAQQLRADGQVAEGIAVLERGRERAQSVLERFDGQVRLDLQLRLAGTVLNLGIFHDQTAASLGQAPQALALFDEAERLLQPLQGSGERSVDELLGTLHGARAVTRMRMGDLPGAAVAAGAALAQRQRVLKDHPGDLVARDGLVTEATNAGVIRFRAGDAAAAVQATTLAWDEVRALARENGADSKWAGAIPRVAQHHGRALLQVGRAAEAAQVLPRAVAWWQQRALATPTPAVRRQAAGMGLLLARAESAAGQGARALATAQPHVAALRTLAAVAPPDVESLLSLADACWQMAGLDPARRRDWQQQAVTHYRSAHALRPLTGEPLKRMQGGG